MNMLDSALAFAARGWPVFPCDPKTKQPLVKGDRDPETGEAIPGSGGVKKATTDAAIIRAWWARWPKAMIGVPTGPAIGAFVIDIDAGEDKTTGEIFEAAELQMTLERAIGTPLPPTPAASTPRGGVHLYFACPPGEPPGNRSDLLGKKSRIDVRGDGGYVIAPPSIRSDDKVYQWRSAQDMPLAAAPPALLDLIFRRGRWAEESVARSIGARAAARVKPPAGAAISDVDQAVRKYALTALDGELETVRGAAEGGRNDALNISALKLGQLVGAGALDEGFVRAALEDAAATCGLVKSDGLRSVRATIESGLGKGKSQPRDLAEVRHAAADRLQRRPRSAAARVTSDPPVASSGSSPSSPAAPPAANGKPSSQTGASAGNSAAAGGGGARKPPRPTEDDDVRNMRLAFYPMTDLGNAERFCERHRDKLKWCEALGWLAWDGKRWSRGGADDLVKIAEHDTVRAIQLEADAVRKSGRKDQAEGGRDFVLDVVKDEPVLYSDKLAKWGRASEAVNKLGALSKRGAPYLAVPIDRLDADKLKINVNNGTLVVNKLAKDGEPSITFHPHDPDDLITKLAPVDYDQAAGCPVYDKFLTEIQPKADIRRFLHQWGGVSMTGDISEQIMAYLYGKGGNGKSVLVEAWSYVAGDYGETVPIETFLDQGKARNAGQATPDIAILPGVRMLRTSEPEKNSKLAEAMVKLVTGGEPIQARHLNRDFFKFYPQFKLTMSGNYRPTIAGTDEGIWRRLRLVPFTVSIPKDKRDIHLPDKLRAEASGILNRLLDGLRDWCDHGLAEPEDVTKATAEYRDASDPLGRFLAMCVVPEEGSRVQSSVLHQVYEAWCKSSGETAWKNRGLSLAMDDRGYKRKQSDVVWWIDIKLIKSASDFVDHEGNPIRVKNGEEEQETEVGDMPF